MKNLTFKTLLCFAALVALSPLSHAQSNGGVIHFQGAIVEAGCGVSQQDKVFSISCSKQGKPAVYKVTLTQLANFSVHSNSPIKTHVRYLDPQHRLAILDITYM